MNTPEIRAWEDPSFSALKGRLASSHLIRAAQDLWALLFSRVSQTSHLRWVRLFFFFIPQRSWNAQSGECLAEQTRRLL